MTDPSVQAAKILGPLSGTATGGACPRPRPAVHIGCQLLPTSRFVDLLERAGFHEVGVIDVTPVHVVVHGTK